MSRFGIVTLGGYHFIVCPSCNNRTSLAASVARAADGVVWLVLICSNCERPLVGLANADRLLNMIEVASATLGKRGVTE